MSVEKSGLTLIRFQDKQKRGGAVENRVYSTADLDIKRGIMVCGDAQGGVSRVCAVYESIASFLRNRQEGEVILFSDGRNLNMVRYFANGCEKAEFRLVREGRDIGKVREKTKEKKRLSRSSINYYSESIIPYLERCDYRVVPEDIEQF